MALTNITKFGLKPELILSKGYKYIIGFDLGDGEVTASFLRLDVPNPDIKDVVLGKVGDGTRLLSGIYIYNDKNIDPVIGSLEQLSKYTEAKGQLYINFKVNPQRLDDGELFEGTTTPKKEIVYTFARECLKAIKPLNPDFDLSGDGILALGCPSSPEWLLDGRDQSYASLIKKAAKDSGLNLTVVVIPESRASLLKVYKEKYTDEIRERMLNGVIVLDSGSSTFDVTYIDFGTNTQHDESIPLGASMIEKTIIRKGLTDKGRKPNEVARALATRLEARSAKEAYFTDPELSPRILLELLDDDLVKVKCTEEFMTAVTEKEKVKYSTETDPLVEGAWSYLHRKFLDNCRKQIQSLTGNEFFKGVVMLTGGASQMQMLQANTKDTFPFALIEIDNKASFCVSRGLSHAMYADLMAFMLIEEAKKKVTAEITSNLTPLKSVMAAKIAPIIYEYVCAQTKEWAEKGKDMTLGDFSKDIKEKFKNGTSEADRKRQAKVREAIHASIVEYLNAKGPDSVRAKIVKVVNDLFRKYFPGQINENHVAEFTIDDAEWGKAVDTVTNFDNASVGKIVNNIDIESGLSIAFKAIGAILVLPVFILTSILDGIFDTSMSDWMEEKLDKAFTKVFYKSDREKAYKKCVNEKDKILGETRKNLTSSILGAESEKQIAQRITSTLSPAIDKAVDNVSLYF